MEDLVLDIMEEEGREGASEETDVEDVLKESELDMDTEDASGKWHGFKHSTDMCSYSVTHLPTSILY